MPFSLPPNFSQDANELGKYVTEFETAVDGAKKDEHLRKALTAACRMLTQLDLQKLRERITEVFSSAEDYKKNWFEEVVQDEGHFNYFLNNVEAAILKGASIDISTRTRVLKEIADLRGLALKYRVEATPDALAQGIKDLQTDICLAKDQLFDAASRAANHTKAVKALCVVAIVTNALGSIFFPGASPAALAASIVVGGIRFVPGQV